MKSASRTRWSSKHGKVLLLESRKLSDQLAKVRLVLIYQPIKQPRNQAAKPEQNNEQTNESNLVLIHQAIGLSLLPHENGVYDYSMTTVIVLYIST